MRIKITFNIRESDLNLPYGYYHYLQAVLYKTMGLDLSNRYHDNCNVKNITFSNLYGEYSINSSKKEIIFKNKVVWYISSIDDSLIKAIINNLSETRAVTLRGQTLILSTIEMDFEQIKKETILIETLSPITVHRTSVDENGKSKTQYYNPNDIEFKELLNQNLRSKKESLGISSSSDNKIELMALNDVKKVIVNYKNFIIEAYQGRFALKGNIDDLNLLYNAGLGCKNTHGFGMFKIIDTY